MRKKQAAVVFIISVIVLVAVVASLSLLPGEATNGVSVNDSQPPETEANVCGDGVCGEQETCLSCGQDCRCGSNKYCTEQGDCVTPECGNSNCEPYENIENCCEDCGPCPNPEAFCNDTTQQCEMPTADIGDGRAIEVAEEYCRNKNWTVESSKIVSSVVVEGKRAKSVRVKVEEDQQARVMAVTEGEQVIEYQFP